MQALMGTQTHWLGVVAAAALGFVIGGAWYGPLFGKAWQAARGLSAAAIAGANMPLIFGLVALLNLFSAFILDHVLATYGAPGLRLSMMISGGLALGFILPAMAVNYLFSRLSLRLYAIDAGYWLVIYTLMGAAIFLLR
jgi:hypothetical protein